MYIWFGIDVNEQLLPLREAIARTEEIVPPAHSGLTLPLHISLKISSVLHAGPMVQTIFVLRIFDLLTG